MSIPNYKAVLERYVKIPMGKWTINIVWAALSLLYGVFIGSLFKEAAALDVAVGGGSFVLLSLGSVEELRQSDAYKILIGVSMVLYGVIYCMDFDLFTGAVTFLGVLLVMRYVQEYFRRDD